MMTSKNWLSGFGRTLGAVVLSTGLMAAGCGDDDPDMTQIDAGGGGTIDAGPTEPDAGCDMPGHGGDNCDPLNPFGAPNGEGGEVRIELFQEGEDQSRLAVQAFFFKNQDPLIRPFFEDPLHDPAQNGGYACFDYKAGEYYNTGNNPRQQEIANGRTYVDVGDTVTITNRDNAEDVMVLTKQAEGAEDPSNHIQHGIVYVGDPTYVPTPASLYGWEIAGSDDYLAFNLLNGASAATQGPVAEGYQPDVYFPQQFTMTSPAEADYFNGPVTFTRGESLTITWDNVGDENEASPGTVSFVGFATEDDLVESWCLRAGDEGQFIVPPEVLDNVGATGKLLVGKFAHTAWLQAQNDDNTRIDVLGVNCKLSSYEIVDP